MSDYSKVMLLDKSHDKTLFDCNEIALNSYLKQFALQNQNKGIVRNYVVCPFGTKNIIGFYSLVFGSVVIDEVPATIAKGIGKDPVPIMILARLAVDKSIQGKGVGKALLKDAMLRTVNASQIAGLKAMFVRAKSEEAKAFYKQFGFMESPAMPLDLFYPLDAINEKQLQNL